MKNLNRLIFIAIVGALFFLSGCAGSGSTHSTIYYEGYYDPYPHWGYGGDTTIIIDLPDKPSRPPGINPPGGGRPKPPGRRQ